MLLSSLLRSVIQAFPYPMIFDSCASDLQAELDEVIKKNIQPEQATNFAQNPTTYSYVYLRIQPFTSPLVLPKQDASAESASTQSTLQFILYLSDPGHNITHSTVTQAIPVKWLDLWDEYDWVEDSVVEAIRVGVEVLGQEYIVSRMGWDQKKAPVDAEKTPVKEESS